MCHQNRDILLIDLILRVGVEIFNQTVVLYNPHNETPVLKGRMTNVITVYFTKCVTHELKSKMTALCACDSAHICWRLS